MTITSKIIKTFYIVTAAIIIALFISFVFQLHRSASEELFEGEIVNYTIVIPVTVVVVLFLLAMLAGNKFVYGYIGKKAVDNFTLPNLL